MRSLPRYFLPAVSPFWKDPSVPVSSFYPSGRRAATKAARLRVPEWDLSRPPPLLSEKFLHAASAPGVSRLCVPAGTCVHLIGFRKS
mmetsp:Transcript_35356/g.81965  ORF Transcript_35356/g.81965 Transcript_35356/m.81965 type:complete len:87 (+) Transcript_35356:331-591(+)